MALAFKLCSVVIFVSCSQAYLTGAGIRPTETCKTSFGRSFREGEAWEKCGAGASCCFHSCECVRRRGSLVESCREACANIGPGCRILESIQNATYHDCCRTECTVEKKQCSSNTGVKYNVGDAWNECSRDRSCCTKVCKCRRRRGVVKRVCRKRCAKIAVPTGCRVVKSALTATNRRCCRTECSAGHRYY